MRSLSLVAVLLAASAFGEVGKVTVLEGKATRTAGGGGAPAELSVGTEIDLGDLLEVKSGNLKFELTDGSVIALAPGSKLQISEAEFEGQERKGFKAFLGAGSLWTKVKKTLTGAKFEVTTDRAVAGVRGTIFRIDADQLVKAAKGRGKASIIRVVEGVVNVKPSEAVVKASHGAVPKPPPKGKHVQVAGPTEISADEWEKKFVDLQANQQVTVGVDLWDQAEAAAASQSDAFSKWLEKN
jgi:hypothetical protein